MPIRTLLCSQCEYRASCRWANEEFRYLRRSDYVAQRERCIGGQKDWLPSEKKEAIRKLKREVQEEDKNDYFILKDETPLDK